MKILFLSVSLFCFSLEAMRAPHRLPVSHRRSMSTYPHKYHAGILKVACKPYMAQEMNRVLRTMNDAQKAEAKRLHAIVQFNAIEGTLSTAAASLATLDHIERSIILDQVDEKGRTLLIKAAQIGYLKFMNFLLRYDVNVNVADNDGFTALTINPRRLGTHIVEKILNHGAHCDHVDLLFKRNVLHYLAMKPLYKLYELYEGEEDMMYEEINAKVARLLIPEGANMYARDNRGKTPIDFALETDHVEILKAFIDCGAKRDTIIEKASDQTKQDLLAHYKVY